MTTMKKPKLRELKEAITALIKGPYTTKFPYEPYVAPETYRGKAEYVDEFCIGCGACSRICPAKAIQVEDELTGSRTGVRKITLRYDHCIFCGQCQRYCTTEKGIRLTNEYDLATFDRSEAVVGIEKELLICEHCNEVISTIDHVRWVAQKLGPKAYGNPTLVLALESDLNLIGETAPRNPTPIWRSDIIRLLCPECRREVIITEEW